MEFSIQSAPWKQENRLYVSLSFPQCLQTVGTQVWRIQLPSGCFPTFRRKGKMTVLYPKKKKGGFWVGWFFFVFLFLQLFFFSKQRCFCFDPGCVKINSSSHLWLWLVFLQMEPKTIDFKRATWWFGAVVGRLLRWLCHPTPPPIGSLVLVMSLPSSGEPLWD